MGFGDGLIDSGRETEVVCVDDEAAQEETVIGKRKTVKYPTSTNREYRLVGAPVTKSEAKPSAGDFLARVGLLEVVLDLLQEFRE